MTSSLDRPKILLLGDSITQLSFSAKMCGWGAHLADVYQRRADVINRGNSGYNSDWFLEYAQKSDVWTQPPKSVCLVIIFFGANDASCSTLNPRHHVPLPKFKSNLEELVNLTRQRYSDASILMVGCPPVHHEQRIEFQKAKYGDKATGELERNMELSQKYAQTAEDVAQGLNIPCLNLWKVISSQPDWGAFFYDGLHFSREGNEFVGEKMVSMINQALPDLQVKPCPFTQQWANSSSKCVSLPPRGPYHDEIDEKNPKAAFDKHEHH
mmetsp:Transcript_25253/g.35610  ORF Transcript_25253/g.35610 Transcript_25253/m.35610 type:complete len:268 (+) Transcript_25253:145-948(+)